MCTDNFRFLYCANSQTLHRVSVIIGDFWTFWGPTKPLFGLKVGLKTGMNSTHVYLQVSSQSISS